MSKFGLPPGYPQRDWLWVETSDRGERTGECAFCGTAIRYVYTIHHPDAPGDRFEVGTVCCNNLMTPYARAQAEGALKHLVRRAKALAEWSDPLTWRPRVAKSGATQLCRKLPRGRRVFLQMCANGSWRWAVLRTGRDPVSGFEKTFSTACVSAFDAAHA